MTPHTKGILLLYGLPTLLFSCTKAVQIHIPKQKPELVVNCLFNPDSTWKVFVGKNSPLEDTSASIVNDAHVTISGSGRTIHLTYSDSGYYVSGRKPQPGIEYTLKVSAPGFPGAEASDSIPGKLTIASYTFDTIPVLITRLDILDNEKANKLVLSIDGFSQKSYAQVKISAYNKNDLYYYTITDSALKKTSIELKEQAKNYPSSIDIAAIISKLSILKGKPILSESRFQKEIHTVAGGSILNVYETVIKYAERKPGRKHLEDLFVPDGIYVKQQPFFNIYDENYYAAFARGNQHSGSFLFYSFREIFNPEYSYWDDALNNGKKRDLELWVELTSLSKAAYRFKTTYIKQQMNRDNLFRDPVQVYSNIKGGYGIFAGYQLQRIRIY